MAALMYDIISIQLFGLSVKTNFNYTVFDLSDNPNERGSGKMEEASVARASEEPSQYWLIGFKDRRLEREYLEDLVEVSSSCFIVGTSLALLLYLALPLPLAAGPQLSETDRSGSPPSVYCHAHRC